tara:strand:- start:15475 stop:16323 length:849 start_codon:yes stop_codon:yes gene_type:complete
MKNTCASCVGLSVNSIIKINNDKKPEWLKKFDYVENFIRKNDKEIKIKKQKNTDTSLILDVGKNKANRYVLYWAASKEKKNEILIKDAKKAYGNFKNHGISKVNKNGKVRLYFNCPRPYSTIEKGKKNRETFYRHIHLCFSNINCNKWLDKVYTKIVVCNYTLKEVMFKHKTGSIVLINALPCEYYQKSHIENSFNIPFNKVNKMSQTDLFSWFREVIKVNYPKLNKLLQQKKINVYELPIVVYCAHKDCDASEQLAKSLLKKGFVNISDFTGGMREYLKYY